MATVETFFPNIRRHLNTPPILRSETLQAACFCSAELDIAGLEAVDCGSPREPARVLSCGHVVGRDCFRRWVDEQRERWRRGGGDGPAVACCPFCKTAAACEDCGRLLAGVAVPGENTGLDAAAEVPLTVPELDSDDASSPVDRCVYCLLAPVLAGEVAKIHDLFAKRVPRLRTPPAVDYILTGRPADPCAPSRRGAVIVVQIEIRVSVGGPGQESTVTWDAAKRLARTLAKGRPRVIEPVWEVVAVDDSEYGLPGRVSELAAWRRHFGDCGTDDDDDYDLWCGEE